MLTDTEWLGLGRLVEQCHSNGEPREHRTHKQEPAVCAKMLRVNN